MNPYIMDVLWLPSSPLPSSVPCSSLEEGICDIVIKSNGKEYK